MSMCPSCGHLDGSWQHKASCQSVESKLPPSLRVGGKPRRLEEDVVSRAPRVRKPAPRPEIQPDGISGQAGISGQPARRGRPKKWASDAERKRATRQAKVEDI